MTSTFTDEELAFDAPILFRCHMLGDLMADPKGKGETLSVGAKTAIKKLVQESLFGARGQLNSKYIKKGLECEQASIDLLNEITCGDFVKNEERRMNPWIQGEPDIVAKGYGVDVKTVWSMETFPLIPEDGANKGYEWQCRGYMMLFDKPKWDVAYCLVDTPDHLIGMEDPEIHKVSHIDPRMRVTFVRYERDAELESKIKEKCEAGQAYFLELKRTILDSRGVSSVFVRQPAPFRQDAKSAFSAAE